MESVALSPTFLDDAIKLYETGLTMKQTAEQLGVTAMTVQRHFKNAGYKPRPNPRAKRRA